MKATLLEAIEEELGELYTEPLGKAWEQALNFITREMMNWKEKAAATPPAGR